MEEKVQMGRGTRERGGGKEEREEGKKWEKKDKIETKLLWITSCT